MQALLKRLVHEHGVPFRQSDGRHIFLYSGQRGERPLKVSAMQNPTAVAARINTWASEHVPGWEQQT